MHLLRSHLWKQQHILYRMLISEHTNSVNAKTNNGCWQHTIFQYTEKMGTKRNEKASVWTSGWWGISGVMVGFRWALSGQTVGKEWAKSGQEVGKV